MDKNSKILITGAEGLVGKSLVKELKNQGYENLILAGRNNLNLTKREEVFEFFKKESPEYIFHTAAKVGGIKENIENPVEFLRDNILINTNVIDAAFMCKTEKMINISSATIYPSKINTPSEEDLFEGKIEEENEAYALSKIVGLKLCEYFNREYNANFITLISPNLYGGYSKFDPSKSNAVAALIVRFHAAKENNLLNVVVWGSGDAQREFLYIGDLAKIMIESMKSIKKEDTFRGAINCGLGKDISIRELAVMIKKIIGFQGELIFDKTKPEGVKKRRLNSSRIKKLLKNVEDTPIEEGLKITYDYFLNSKNKDGRAN